MLYTNIPHQSFLGSGEIFLVYLPYIVMADILVNEARPLEETLNPSLVEGASWN